MGCPRCGRTAADTDRFCGGCGAELAATCRHCGRWLDVDAAFCTGCGAARAERGLATAVTEDRRRVSVLFIDLIGFTPYAEHQDPELVRRMQTSFYATARRVVAQYGGVVEKYIGDAVMAVFGAPVATETDALRCVRAGLELQRVLTTLDETAPADDRGGMQFRVGIATGEALVDLSAARDGGQAIVSGDVVNTASRLQAVAPAEGVLVCGHTRALTVEAVRYAEQPPVTLRGRSSPTEVWLALAPHHREPATMDPTPLVEREHELSLLTNVLQRTIAGRAPQLVTVLGQAGLGKSRLVRELYRGRQRAAGDSTTLTWHTGHCPPFGENITYAGLADIIKAEAGILDTDSAATARSRLRHAARAVAPEADADRLAAALGPLVGLPGNEVGLPGNEPPVKEAEAAWRRFLVGMAARRPTVLVFEDLHWADAPMRRFLELLTTAAQDAPLLVLATARPELVDRDPAWAGTIAGSVTVTLPPLRDSGIATLYSQLTGDPELPPRVRDSLVELANGNPLYAQEYVRMLTERGALPRAGEEWPQQQELALPTPESVQAVIGNRVDLLEPADRAVLQAAAVVGIQFWPGAVAAGLGHGTEPVAESLRRLEQREFVVEALDSSVAGESEFRFRHMLVRDVCYQRLPRAERVARHERTADWLASLSWQRGTELAEVLAHHRWAAHEIARTLGTPVHRYAVAAREALYQAARRAYTLYALETAAGHADRALGLFETPQGGDQMEAALVEPDRLRVELLATEIAFYRDQSAFLTSGGVDRLSGLANRLAQLGADREAARAWTLLGQAAWLQADRAAALTYLGKAVALFDRLPDSPEKVDAYGELGRLHMLNYELEPAVSAARVAAEIARRLELVEAQTNARITMATARFEAGDPAALDQLQELTQHCRDQRLLALRRATQNLATAMLEEGHWQRTIALLSEPQPRVQGGHNLVTGYSLAAIRAYATGELDEFAAAADAALELPGGRWDMRARGLRAVLRALRREPGPPTDEVADAVAMARESGFHRPLWTALALAALCRALQQRHTEAAELLGELIEEWRKVPVMASGEWVCAAAHAGALVGPAPAAALRDALTEAGTRHTRWAQAALHTVTGGDPDAADAGRRHLAAAEIYADIPSLTDRALSLALSARASTRDGDHEQAAGPLAEVRAFVDRTGTVTLLRLAEPPAGP